MEAQTLASETCVVEVLAATRMLKNCHFNRVGRGNDGNEEAVVVTNQAEHGVGFESKCAL